MEGAKVCHRQDACATSFTSQRSTL